MKKRPDNEGPSIEESKRILREAAPEAFDGHTAFADLSFEQRIEWASRSAQLVLWAREWRTGQDADPSPPESDDPRRSNR